MSSMSWSLDNAESVSLLCIEKCLLVWVFAGFYLDYLSSMRIWRRCSSTVRQMRSSQYNAFLTAGSQRNARILSRNLFRSTTECGLFVRPGFDGGKGCILFKAVNEHVLPGNGDGEGVVAQRTGKLGAPGILGRVSGCSAVVFAVCGFGCGFLVPHRSAKSGCFGEYLNVFAGFLCCFVWFYESFGIYCGLNFRKVYGG